jgi:transposase
MEILKQNVGIDVSKDTLACCLMSINNELKTKVISSRKITNNLNGFKELKKWVELKKRKDLSVTFTMEYTGVYHENLAYFLFDNDFAVSIVLPNRAKKFADSIQEKAKTDPIDAKALGRMGLERSLNTWAPPSKKIKLLKTLVRERDFIITERTSFKNNLHAVEHSATPDEVSTKKLKRLIASMNKVINEIEADCHKIINNDDFLKQKVEILESIPGVGFLTIISIIAETDGFTLIKSIKQLVSYAGLDVRIKESGKWKGKARISKKGNAHIRKALYFPALSTSKHSKTNSIFYNRIKDKKGSSMIAISAMQRKLLGLMYTLWKNDTYYIEDYSSARKQISGDKEIKPSFIFNEA